MPLKRLTHERYARMRADGTFPTFPDPPEPPAPPPINDDLRAIKETRPTWWQVRRIEQDAHGTHRYVLIYECRDETTAMKVCLAQRWRCLVARWGDKQKPFENFKPIKAIEPAEPVDPRRV